MKKNKNTQNKSHNSSMIYLVTTISVLLLLIVLWTKVLINSYIPSESMEPTLRAGDKVIGNRLAYAFGEKPERLDVVIFQSPDEDDMLYIKRIIGLPGETVVIKNGQVYVDDTLIENSFIKEAMEEEPDMEFQVPKDHYFMMGDNRNESFDSRYWEHPYVSEDAIVAKALVRYWKEWKQIK